MLFERIVVVDWSASSAPTTGADSVWIAVADAGGIELSNPSTRRVALAKIATAANAAGSTLIGVDFSLGFPRGTAEALGLVGRPWRAMWELLGSEISDDDRNRNNRFAVASRLNADVAAPTEIAAGPFWGCPPAQRTDYLTSTKPARAVRWPPEWRHVESRLRDEGLRPFSAWQLLGAGAVGSQSLVGIAALERLRWNLGERLCVWPFDTGLAAPTDADVVVAEVWPSRWPVTVPCDMVKDAAQVQATAQRLFDMNSEGTLGALFAPLVESSQLDDVLGEEGWVLGVT
ncbi:MAG: hypothetical protein ACI9N0_001674 [Ilumatobacter sp.]